MNYKLDVPKVVYAELADIHDYIAADSPRYAKEWLKEAYAALSSLRSMPQRCSLAPENENMALEVRHLIYKSHRILFTVRSDTVHILHVRHTSQRELDQLRQPSEE